MCHGHPIAPNYSCFSKLSTRRVNLNIDILGKMQHCGKMCLVSIRYQEYELPISDVWDTRDQHATHLTPTHP
jgi:hypothetical protein